MNRRREISKLWEQIPTHVDTGAIDSDLPAYFGAKLPVVSVQSCQ